jgi:nucleotide-binding universal stress UspA family protein
MFQRIIVPLDGSIHAARAVPVAAWIAELTHGDIILVCVVNHFVLGQPATTPPSNLYDHDDFSIHEAEAYLEEISHAPELVHLPIEKMILSGPVASTLLFAAHSSHADLMVLSSHGRSGIHHKAFGSISEKIVYRTSIPVLILRENNALFANTSSLPPHSSIHNTDTNNISF